MTKKLTLGERISNLEDAERRQRFFEERSKRAIHDISERASDSAGRVGKIEKRLGPIEKALAEPVPAPRPTMCPDGEHKWEPSAVVPGLEPKAKYPVVVGRACPVCGTSQSQGFEQTAHGIVTAMAWQRGQKLPAPPKPTWRDRLGDVLAAMILAGMAATHILVVVWVIRHW